MSQQLLLWLFTLLVSSQQLLRTTVGHAAEPAPAIPVAKAAGLLPPEVAKRRLIGAVIDRTKDPLGALLEQRFLSESSMDWVERTTLDKLVAERELQALFASEEVVKRTELAQLLKADVLVIVQKPKPIDKQLPRLEVVIIESNYGLRLWTKSYELLPTKQTELIQQIWEDFETARRKLLAPALQLVAVAPFVSDNLTKEYDHLQTAYAQLIAEALQTTPQLLLVDLLEARALAQELQLDPQATALRRPLQPLFITGQFRHSRDPLKPGERLTIELRQNSRLIKQLESEQMESHSVPDWLFTHVPKLLADKTQQVVNKKYDRATEFKQIKQQAQVLARLSNWQQCANLCEAGLLLEPKDLALHLLAIDAYAYQFQQSGYTPKFAEREAVLMVNYNLYRQALRHWEQLATISDEPLSNKRIYGEMGAYAFERGLHFYVRPEIQLPATKEMILETAAIREATYWRIVCSRRDRGLSDCTAYASPLFIPNAIDVPGDLKRRIDVYLKMLSLISSSPDFDKFDKHFFISAQMNTRLPEVQAYYQQLLTSDDPNYRKIGELLSKRYPLQTGPAPMFPARDRTPILFQDKLSETKLRLAQVSLSVPTLKTNERLLDFIPIPNQGGDLIKTNFRLLRIDNAGKTQEIFQILPKTINPPLIEIKECCCDGTYAWITISKNIKELELLAIHLQSKKVHPITAAAGLIIDADNRCTIKMQPIGPGKICLIAHFGRSWLGIVSVSETTPAQVKIFHEFKSAPQPNSTPEQILEQSFEPAALFAEQPVTSTENHQFLLMTSFNPRSNDRRPVFLINTQHKTVQLIDFPKLTFNHRNGLIVAERQLWYVAPPLDLKPREKVKLYLHKIAFAADAKPEIVTPVPGGAMLSSTAGEIHGVGRSYWRYTLKTQQLTMVAPEIEWRFMDSYFSEPADKELSNRSELNNFHFTNQFGLLLETTTPHPAVGYRQKAYYQVLKTD